MRSAALGALLAAMVVAAYGPAFQAGFVWDDDDYVTENPLLPAADGLRRIWLTMDAPSQYVPVVYTSLRLDHALWGLDPFGYHLVNVLLHALNALLAWRLLARLRVPGAWLAAAVFGLHPVQVESVAWIAERKNLFSLLFSLLALNAWVRFTEPGARRPGVCYALALGFQALALLSKATACTLPAAQLLLLWWQGRPIGRRRLVQVVPFLLLGVAMGLVAMFWERVHIGTVGSRFGLGFVEAVLVGSRAIWFYLGKLLWPVDLTFSYPRFEIDPADPLQWGWVVAGGLLLAALWAGRDRIGRGPLAAALYFVASLSPLLGFIPLFTFWYTFVADHYQYTASIGPIALFVGVVVHGVRRGSGGVPATARGAAALLLLLLGALTWSQSRIYESRETLWRDTIAKNPASWMAHTNLGRALADEGRDEEAIPWFRRALEVRPETFRAHLGIAAASARLGRDEDALHHYRAAVAIQPDLVGVHRALASLYWKRRAFEAALVHYRTVAELAPLDPASQLQLARALDLAGLREEAEIHYRRVLELDPEHPTVLRRLGATGPGPEAAP